MEIMETDNNIEALIPVFMAAIAALQNESSDKIIIKQIRRTAYPTSMWSDASRPRTGGINNK